MMWIDRLLAAEKINRFTAEDQRDIKTTCCMVGEALHLNDDMTIFELEAVIARYDLDQEWNPLCPMAVKHNNVKEARRLWEKVQEKVRLFKEVSAK